MAGKSRSNWLWTPRFWLGIAISLLALYLAAKDVKWPEVATVLSRADSLVLLLALGSVLLTTWAKAVRWQWLFYPRHSRLSMRHCISVLLIGQLANNLLPARLGELVRAYLIGERGPAGQDANNKISKVFALATTLVEKGLDSVMLLLLIALLSSWMPIPWWLRRSSLMVSGVLAVLLLAVIITASQRKRIVAALQCWSERFPVLAFLHILERLIEASGELCALRDVGVQVRLWGWSALIWILAVATNLLTFRAIDLDVPPLASLLLLVVLMAGTIVPTSPIQLGVFHYLCVLALSVFGVEPNVALSYAILLHLVVYLPIVVGGVLGLWVEDYELGKLSTACGGRG